MTHLGCVSFNGTQLGGSDFALTKGYRHYIEMHWMLFTNFQTKITEVNALAMQVNKCTQEDVRITVLPGLINGLFNAATFKIV